MGAAVCTMHYTGMAAADYICTTTNRRAFPDGFGIISSTQLPLLVTGVALGIALVIFIDQMMQRMQAQEEQARPPAL